MLRCGILCLLLATPAASVAQGAPPAGSTEPFVVEYYYKVRWGYADEFIRLFKKNHFPVLKRQIELGHAQQVTAEAPRFHGTEDGRWDYRVTIVWKNAAAPHEAFPDAELKRLFHDQGFVQLAAIVDTTGRVEPASVEVLSTPDSGLNDAVEQMMLASRFSVGRLKGAAVRVMVQMGVDVRPPRLSATELVRSARAHLAAGRPDSALTLLDLALDSALAHPTDGERSYALLVRGSAASRVGRDS